MPQIVKAKDLPLGAIVIDKDTRRKTNNSIIRWVVKNHGHFGSNTTLLMTDKIEAYMPAFVTEDYDDIRSRILCREPIREWLYLGYEHHSVDDFQDHDTDGYEYSTFYDNFSELLKKHIVPQTVEIGIYHSGVTGTVVVWENAPVFVLSEVEMGFNYGAGGRGRPIADFILPTFSNAQSNFLWARPYYPINGSMIIFNDDTRAAVNHVTKQYQEYNSLFSAGIWPGIAISNDSSFLYQWVPEIQEDVYVLMEGHMPTYAKINQNNRLLIEGYTKVNGQVKEIIEGYTKIGGQIKRIF